METYLALSLFFDEEVVFPHLIRNSYFTIFLENNADIFYASLLISYCSFSSLIFSLIVMISFYILSKRFFLKREGFSDARVIAITKKEYGFSADLL